MISLWQLNRILPINLIQSKHSNASIASMNGVFLTSDESSWLHPQAMQFVQNNFYRTTAEDKPHHDKAFGYLVYCTGTKNPEMIEINIIKELSQSNYLSR